MTLPSIPSGTPSRESLRIGGGYNAPAAGLSPAGGLDIDQAGNLAMNGDLTVSGSLCVAQSADLPLAGDFYTLPGGCNKTWSRFIGTGEMVKSDGTLAQRIILNSSNVYLPAIAFSPDAHEYAGVSVGLSPDYNGGLLRFTLYWTALDGAAGEVLWNHRLNAVHHGETLNITSSGYGTILSSFIATRNLHEASFTFTPLAANAGDSFVTLLIGRRGAEAVDTFNGTAQLLGINVAYA